MKNLQKFDLEDRFRVRPGKKVNLKRDFDPEFTVRMDKEEARRRLEAGVAQLAEYQDKLYAQNTYALLIIFQAMDAAGKDGTIKHVMSGLNPQGCQVNSFKVPSEEELNHDYLWRAVKALPERGNIGIFNRSYYEEVLVVRVHPQILDRQYLPPEAKDKGVWGRRYDQINSFERHLVENGTRVLKIFLNVSKKEQKRRFLERIDQPEKNWKFSAKDVEERQHWDAYMHAYEQCLAHTSTKWAPWYVVPADDKPFTRLSVAYLIARELKKLKLAYPKLPDEARRALAEAKARLELE